MERLQCLSALSVASFSENPLSEDDNEPNDDDHEEDWEEGADEEDDSD